MRFEKIRPTLVVSLLGILFAFASAAAIAQQQPQGKEASEWKAVEGAMNRSGEAQPDGAFKFSMPRKDLKVTVAGTQVKAGLALGSWAAFKKMGNQAMLMGDLVLTEQEVEPVMKKLQEGGVEITALHNHLLGETPRVMYMHIGGMGDPVKLAQTIRAALDLTKTPPADSASPAAAQEKLDIDTARIEQILGHKGKIKGGILQFSIPRATPSKLEIKGTDSLGLGAPDIPNSMGVAQALNFEPTGNGKAAITGDFVLIAKEVNPVMRALRDNGIEVTALHSHMIEEQPRLFFMHFWANNDAVKLAQGLRAALDKTDSKKAEVK
ncbi:MAG TPA: DUF1259 domain-containing protein [Terriglobales bacterium]|nr:DUF1259 domain-containing protein [Terriglobales bacterium]